MPRSHKIIGKTLLYPWISWLIVALLYFFQYSLLVMPSVFGSELLSAMSLGPTEIGIIYSAFLYTYVFMQIPVGLLYDRYQARYILFFSTMILVLGCMLMTIASSMWVGILARMIMGFGGSFAFIGALYIGRNWFPIFLFPIIVGLTEAMSGLSVVILLPAMAYLEKHQDWRFILQEFTLVLIILAMLIFILIRDRHSAEEKRKKKPALKNIKFVIKKPVLWILCLYVSFIFSFPMVIANMWGIPLLSDYYHISKESAAIEVSVVMLGFIIGSYCVGMFTRYISNRSMIWWLTLIQFIAVAIFWYFDISLLIAGVLFFIIGFTCSSIVLCFDLVKKIFPEYCYGLASGFLNMFFGLIGIVLSPIVGYVFSSTKSDVDALIPLLICSFLALVLAFFLKRIKIRRLPEKSQGF